MQGKRAVVTGSSSGIGLAIARGLIAAGADVVINSHRAGDAAVAADLGADFIQADLSTVAGCRDLIARAAALRGGLDVLVCNAGGFFDCDFADLDEARFDRTFDLNVRGYLFCAQAFAALATPGAAILCVGSTNSLAAEANSVSYDASKGAVLMLVRSLAVTLAPKGIRVNGIGPGIVDTTLTHAALEQGNTRAVLSAQIPMGRIGQPGDVAGAAVFLVSDAAAYVTGQMLYVDGGILAQQMSWAGG